MIHRFKNKKDGYIHTLEKIEETPVNGTMEKFYFLVCNKGLHIVSEKELTENYVSIRQPIAEDTTGIDVRYGDKFFKNKTNEVYTISGINHIPIYDECNDIKDVVIAIIFTKDDKDYYILDKNTFVTKFTKVKE